MLFGQVMTAMITCFDENGSLNLAENARLAKFLLEHGTDTLVVAGTTGESPALSFEEKVNLFETVKAQAGSCKVIANTGSYNTEESIKLSIAAQKTGADGLMLVVPYYNKPSQEGLYHHFKRIAQAVELPVMLYNVPSRTSRNLEASTVARLAEDVENIVAIKEAAGQMDQTTLLKKILPEEFAIYSGDDSQTLPMLSLGAAGVVSVASHLIGKEIQRMISAFKSGDFKTALQIHLDSFDLFKTLFIQTNPVMVKKAMSLMGFSTGSVRLPLLDADDKEEAALIRVMNDLKLLRN